MKIMQVDTVLNKQGQDLYNGLAWLLLATSQRQFVLAWKLWHQQRKEKMVPRKRGLVISCSV